MTDYRQIIKKYLDKERFEHSLNTAAEAVKLARAYGADEEKAYTAGMLHDIAKCLTAEDAIAAVRKYGAEADDYCLANAELLHGMVGALIAEHELKIADREILSAIDCHTTGKKGMTLLDSIIYIADLIEPLREFKGIGEIRQAAYRDLNAAVILAAKSVIAYVMERGLVVHPKTVDAYNDAILKRRNTVG